MQIVCFPYAIHMLNICSNMQEYDKNMHKYAIVKYAQICMNMQKICTKYAQICINMQGIGTLQNRQKICKLYAQICINMQYMQSRISYAEYARICTPHFADDAARQVWLYNIHGFTITHPPSPNLPDEYK